jgi:two-component system, OmpR family, alkaline phosphatase synthesis response regulator PhoP
MVDEQHKLEFAGVVLNPATRSALLNGQPLSLTRSEFGILLFLMQSDGRVLSREEIIVAVQGSDYPVTARSVDGHVLALRKKLGSHAHLIETVRGAGFRRRSDAQPPSRQVDNTNGV